MIWKFGQIRLLVSMATDRVIMEKNGVATFSQSFFIANPFPTWEVRWPSCRGSDFRGRVREFDPHWVTILEQDTFTSKKLLTIPRKRWLHPDMTEKLLTGT